jgi:hypothetical protein
MKKRPPTATALFQLPPSVYVALAHDMRTRGVLNDDDQRHKNGVQLGIGFGIRAFKLELMDQLRTTGRLFGRPMPLDHVQQDREEQIRDIDDSRRPFDRLVAKRAADNFVDYEMQCGKQMTGGVPYDFNKDFGLDPPTSESARRIAASGASLGQPGRHPLESCYRGDSVSATRTVGSKHTNNIDGAAEERPSGSSTVQKDETKDDCGLSYSGTNSVPATPSLVTTEDGRATIQT